MFKKKVEFKGSSVVGGKNLKKLKGDAFRSFGVSEESVMQLFPHKTDIMVKKVAWGGSKIQVYHAGEVPILVDDGRGGLYPTVMGLWTSPECLPYLMVPQPVSKFLCGGADLMFPGVRGMSAESIPAGTLVAVKVMGNPMPVAVGICLFDPATATSREGKVVEVLQVYGDNLWELQSAKPNAGFVDGEVLPIEEEGQAAAAGEGAAAGGGTGAAEGAGGDAGGEEGGGGEDGEEEEEEDGSAGLGGLSIAPEEMDALLQRAFLQAARGLKDKDLPVETSLFYAQHMRPARPKGTTLDIKRSSHKKLAAFLSALVSEGLLRIASSKGQAKITEIKRSHPLYREYTPLPFEETAGGEKALEAESAAAAKAPPPIEVEERFRPHHSMYGPLFPDDRQAHLQDRTPNTGDRLVTLESVDGEASLRVRYYTAQQCRNALQEYIDKEGLVDPMSEGSIVLDPHLCDALYQGETHAGPLPTHLARAEVAKRFTKRLSTFFLMQGGSLKKPNILPAKYVEGPGGVKEPRAPGVSIKTENRRGHHVTVLRGLEILGVDPEAFAEEMKVAFAASTAVEAQTNQAGKKSYEVMMQGYWDKTLAQHLQQVYKLPKMCIEVHAKKANSEKNPKSASNICKN